MHGRRVLEKSITYVGLDVASPSQSAGVDIDAPSLDGRTEIRASGASHRAGGLHRRSRGGDDVAEAHIDASLPDWSLAPVVRALQALRGMAMVAAATVIAELGDITRFANPRQLMAISVWFRRRTRAAPHAAKSGRWVGPIQLASLDGVRGRACRRA
jgi:hypothetical protein